MAENINKIIAKLRFDQTSTFVMVCNVDDDDEEEEEGGSIQILNHKKYTDSAIRKTSDNIDPEIYIFLDYLLHRYGYRV